ncbi:MAG: F0F1 ATP synthase subunit B [Clostridium sp.]|uniref:F0F1 ATP synthase subunit B n=1 Tax=Clostridium sp. TaxID=1506 RepID=UPI002FCB6AB8
MDIGVGINVTLETFVLTIVNVLILYWFLRKFLFEKVSTFMANRANAIESDIKEAKDDKSSAKELKLKYEAQMETAEVEGKKIVEEYKAKANKLSDEMIEEAKKEAALVRERAKADAEREMDKAKDEIKKQIIALSMLAAAKSMGGQLDETKHRDLIQEFIDKVGV